MQTVILVIVLTISFSLSNGFLFGQEISQSSPSQDDPAQRVLSREDPAEWEKDLTKWEKELRERELDVSKLEDEAVESEGEEAYRSASEEYEKYKTYSPLRKYRQHFSSITSWSFYGPSDFGNPPYGTVDPKDNLFGTEFLGISADEHDHIFISDGLTGEVFRDYFCQLRPYDIINSSAKITHVVLSPQARLFAYHKDFSVVVCDTSIRDRVHCFFFSIAELLSLSFRKEPLNGCDILEVVEKERRGICRWYFAIPVDPNFTSSGPLRKHKLEDLEGVCEKVEDSAKGDFECFPVFGKANNVEQGEYLDGAIKWAEYCHKGDLEWMQYMREHTTPESDSKPSKTEDQSQESPVVEEP